MTSIRTASGIAFSAAFILLMSNPSLADENDSRTDQFDMLMAIQQWVEQNKAPDRVIASGRAFSGKTRPLCPYPKVARFQGGNPDTHESFSCR